MATKKARKSGSKKLSAKRGARAPGPLAAVVAALDRSKIKHSILIRGTPIPDIIKGTIMAASGGQAGSAITVLMKAANVQYKPLRLFPRGIPIPDIIRIEVDGKMIR